MLTNLRIIFRWSLWPICCKNAYWARFKICLCRSTPFHSVNIHMRFIAATRQFYSITTSGIIASIHIHTNPAPQRTSSWIITLYSPSLLRSPASVPSCSSMWCYRRQPFALHPSPPLRIRSFVSHKSPSIIPQPLWRPPQMLRSQSCGRILRYILEINVMWTIRATALAKWRLQTTPPWSTRRWTSVSFSYIRCVFRLWMVCGRSFRAALIRIWQIWNVRLRRYVDDISSYWCGFWSNDFVRTPII